MKSRVHIFISGLVQGVFFRYATKSEAGRLGLTGWVRNIRDGRVEVLAEGEKSEIEKLISWCHQGPPGAVVKNVEYELEDYKGEYSVFSIRY